MQVKGPKPFRKANLEAKLAHKLYFNILREKGKEFLVHTFKVRVSWFGTFKKYLDNDESGVFSLVNHMI